MIIEQNNETTTSKTRELVGETNHRILVCTTCASVWENGQRVGISGGQKLLENLRRLEREQCQISEVECMSACSNACVVSFTAPNKFTYVFGGLSPETGAEAVLECASKYLDKPDGLLTWNERPEPLRRGIIARIPPLSSEK